MKFISKNYNKRGVASSKNHFPSSMNKKAVSISILLLVIGSLVITAVSLAYFYTKNNDIKKVIHVSGSLDEVYNKENLLNFYLQDIFDKAVEDFKFEFGKNAFADNFRKEIDGYKDKKGLYPIKELEQVESISKESLIENIELTENKLVLKLNLEIKEVYGNVGEDGGVFVYNYEKSFEKVFSKES